MIDKKINLKKEDKVRLIGVDGKQIGVISFEEAEKIAEKQGLDLILVNAKQDPVVLRLGNFKTYLYQKEKKKKEKKKPKETKEIRISFNEALFDLKRKSELIKEFLEKGHQVQIRLMLKGREKNFSDLAEEKLNNFLKIISEIVSYKISQPLRKFPNFYSIVISR